MGDRPGLFTPSARASRHAAVSAASSPPLDPARSTGADAQLLIASAPPSPASPDRVGRGPHHAQAGPPLALRPGTAASRRSQEDQRRLRGSTRGFHHRFLGDPYLLLGNPPRTPGPQLASFARLSGPKTRARATSNSPPKPVNRAVCSRSAEAWTGPLGGNLARTSPRPTCATCSSTGPRCVVACLPSGRTALGRPPQRGRASQPIVSVHRELLITVDAPHYHYVSSPPEREERLR